MFDMNENGETGKNGVRAYFCNEIEYVQCMEVFRSIDQVLYFHHQNQEFTKYTAIESASQREIKIN